MRTILTPDVLKTMSCDEFEDWRDSGEDFRRELTHAVMRDLSCPENWDVNGEYRSEFGGSFPVQVRFTPPHGNYHIAVCSPGAISPAWMVVFVPASGTKNGVSVSGRTRRWRGRRRLSWHSIRLKRSAAGAHAGRGLNCASTTWKRCSGAGASVSRHWSQWSAGRWRVSLSGR